MYYWNTFTGHIQWEKPPDYQRHEEVDFMKGSTSAYSSPPLPTLSLSFSAAHFCCFLQRLAVVLTTFLSLRTLQACCHAQATRPRPIPHRQAQSEAACLPRRPPSCRWIHLRVAAGPTTASKAPLTPTRLNASATPTPEGPPNQRAALKQQRGRASTFTSSRTCARPAAKTQLQLGKQLYRWNPN